MKIDGRGQAKTLTLAEITRIDAELLKHGVKYSAVFNLCLYTGCRIAEALKLRASDVYAPNGALLAEITLRKCNTKGQIATRQIPVHPRLRMVLSAYWLGLRTTGNTGLTPQGKLCLDSWADLHLFPSTKAGRGISPQAFDKVLRAACAEVGCTGVSSHSMRRTFITQLARANHDYKSIAQLSGHRDISNLALYVDADDKTKDKLVQSLNY